MAPTVVAQAPATSPTAPAETSPALAARLTPADVAGIFRRHPVTVRNALASGELHGSQRVKGGRWLIDENCAVALSDGRPCTHQLEDRKVRPLRVVGGAR